MPTGPRGERRPADVIGAAIIGARINTGEVAEDSKRKPGWFVPVMLPRAPMPLVVPLKKEVPSLSAPPRAGWVRRCSYG